MAISQEKSIETIVKRLPPFVREELDEFESYVKKFQAGQMGEIKFQKIRLQLGTYAQRQAGFQMQRIKIPYGGLTSAQLRCLAGVSEKYASGFIHLTTRQDVQLYFIKLETVPNMMRELADAGITTREACGNTVRNVTACYRAGISTTESFDVTPYTEAFVQFMLRNPICQNMGRKFKVAFEGCQEADHAGMRIHDLGFQARVKDGKRGFQLFVGGGLGAQPMLGYLWSDFIPVEEMIPLSAAIVRVFDRYGERKLRMQARMKFLIKKIGWDEFKKRVEAERKALKVNPSWNNFLKDIQEHEIPPLTPRSIPRAPVGIEKTPHYLKWKESCVISNRAKGFATVHVRIKLGDLTAEKARQLSDVSDVYSAGKLRITIQQNLILRWIPIDALSALYDELKRIDLVYLGAETFEDITACPGADTCRLGITSAKGLATRLEDNMKNGLGEFKELAKDLNIKISGCPNACAQHVVANIGFQGAATTKDGRTVPSELVFVGGSLLGKDTRLGEPLIKVPTRNAPLVVKKLLELYREEKRGEEHFDLVMQRIGAERLKKELEEFTPIPTFEEDPSFYQDWGHEAEKFELQKGVKGECAGATVEEKIPTFADAERRLEQAKAFLVHQEYKASILESFHAAAASCHVPLYSKLVDPFTTDQTFWEFENLFVRTGEADPKWMNMAERLKLERDGESDEEQALQILELAKEIHAECQRIQTKFESASKG